MQIPYSLIRSKRRTLSIHINDIGTLIVRSPMRLSISHIEDFLVQKKDWIEKHQKKRENNIPRKLLSENEIKLYKKNIREYIIPRTHELWEGKGLPPITSIKITQSEKRWGSCSSKNGLCFSYRLSEYLEEKSIFIDAIIIHELAHFTQKNHQKPFWDLVYSWMPNYDIVIKNK